MTPDTFIQATVAIGFALGGFALGVVVQREVVAAAREGRPHRWPWLTPTRFMAVGVVLIAVCGILTAVSVRSCQSGYNAQFERSSAATRVATDLLYEALIDLNEGLRSPEQRVRQAAFNTFDERLRAARKLRQENPLPPQPHC